MHAAIVHLSPILGAEKSKVPFYIAGGVLVAWALIVSLGLGLRVASFPANAMAARLVMAVSAALVLVVVATAVITSGGSKTAEASGAGSAPATSASPTSTTAPPTSTTAAPSGAPAKAVGHGGATTLTEAADPSGQLRFMTPRLTARAGRVTIDFSNSSPLAHNLTVAQGAKVLGATPTFQGASKALTLSLKPGAYKFFCTVPGHRQAGMEGTLEVS